MTDKIKRRILIVFLLISYCTGMLFAPINAEESQLADGLDMLLSERQDSAVLVEEKTDISDFADVKSDDWFYVYLDYLVKNEIVRGKTKNAFEPSGTFSYGECGAVIVRYLGLEEEAEKRRKMLVSRIPEAEHMWYAGYFDVLYELGLFTDYGLFEVQNGEIVSIDRDAANSPVVRYRFAESISKSFELSSDELYAKNVYGEIGGRGREFIVGGTYDADILSHYEALIADFEDIPEGSRIDVLKAYYNGIFNGDAVGNFNPMNNLTRAEMAKVLATVTNYSLRTRLVEDGYGRLFSEDSFHTDFAGVTTLSYDEWTALLYREAEKINVSNFQIEYEKGSAPIGYVYDAYLYEKRGEEYVLFSQSTLHDGNPDGLSSSLDDAKILLVLRNVSEKARPEGVLEVLIESGRIMDIRPCIYENDNETPTDAGVLFL